MYELDYVECLIQRKQSSLYTFLKYLFGLLAVLCLLFSFAGQMMGPLVMFGMLALAVVFGIGAYWMHLNSNIEYEYQYCEKEITIDRILNKSKRKRVGKYEIERMDAFGPVASYHLDEYKNKNYKEQDYGDGEISKPDTRYALYYDGREKLIMNPDEKLIAAVYAVAPRKTFKD